MSLHHTNRCRPPDYRRRSHYSRDGDRRSGSGRQRDGDHTPTRLVRLGRDPAVVRQFFRIIEEQADHMHDLVADLLDVARIETGTRTPTEATPPESTPAKKP